MMGLGGGGISSFPRDVRAVLPDGFLAFAFGCEAFFVVEAVVRLGTDARFAGAADLTIVVAGAGAVGGCVVIGAGAGAASRAACSTVAAGDACELGAADAAGDFVVVSEVPPISPSMNGFAIQS